MRESYNIFRVRAGKDAERAAQFAFGPEIAAVSQRGSEDDHDDE
jgi:hypothetical protein